ncbi:MAG: amidohydrolase family protein [Gemmatimonadaceae bacterium]|nr:amidohydrolase family protein [Gemmatimonadaceae bacterium]
MLSATLFAAAVAAAVPTPDSIVYPVINHDRTAGSMTVRRSGDTVTVRYVFTDRNRGTRTFVRYLTRQGRIVSTEIRPVLADDRLGEPSMRLEMAGDSVRRWTPAATSTEVRRADTYYGVSATPYDQVLLAKQLLSARTHTMRLANGDSSRLEILRTVTVRATRGAQIVRLVAIYRGTSTTPQVLWLDAHDDLFVTDVGWFMTVKPGALSALPQLRRVEMQYRDAQAESLNARVMTRAGSAIAIRNGDLFDSETGTMRPRTTVIVRGDRIVAVGPDDTTPTPAGATVIDATGKTILPGMWDMHGHLQLTSQNSGSLMQLMTGITTVRDLAADLDVAVSQRDRAQAGRIAAPRAVLAGFMEGPLKWAGPSATLVSTEAEARAWVARYDSLGYKQIKLYNVLHPDLVPTIAAEAHARGMRLSGHIPRGLTVEAAIRLGFDEVNHAAFLFSTFYQDSLYVPAMRAYSAVASAVAANIDVDGKPMTDLITLLKAKGTVIDGTFAVWVQSAGTGIAQSVGAGVSADVAKADANYLRLLKRLYDAGVTLVPGTDAFGSTSFDTELEMYEKVGIPAASVLQMATIVSARVMNDEKDYGSVSVGKVADLFIVNGKPQERISDVRKVEHVIRGGRLYNTATLQQALGTRGQ